MAGGPVISALTVHHSWRSTVTLVSTHSHCHCHRHRLSAQPAGLAPRFHSHDPTCQPPQPPSFLITCPFLQLSYSKIMVCYL